MSKNSGDAPGPPPEAHFSPEEIARRRDATIKAMIATPPTKQQDMPKKRPKKAKRSLQKA